MVRPWSFVLLAALACLLTLFLPFCVPSVESKVILPGADGASNGPPNQPGGSGDQGGDPDDIAINSPVGGTGLLGGTVFRLGEHGAIVWTEEYAVSREERVVNARRENARLLWLVLRMTRLFPFVL